MASEHTESEILRTAASGNLEKLQRLYQQKDDINLKDSVFLERILPEAIRHNQVMVVQWCLEKGAKITDPVISALLDDKTLPCFQLLISHGLDINCNLDRLGTFLILAVKRNSSTQVSWCLSHGADPNLGAYAHVWSALGVAAEFGADLKIVEMLLDNGVRLNGSDGLQAAAERGRIDMVELLLDRGAPIDEIGFAGAAGSEVKRENARSALHLAAEKGHIEIVKLLLERGADPHVRDLQGRTPLERAKGGGEQAVVALLQNRDSS